MQFWYRKRLLNYLLIPIACIWQFITYIRLKKKGKSVKPLVVCVGNITVGGAGKTPFTIFLAKELQKFGLKVAVLSRGYGGKLKTPALLVNNEVHKASLIGDEACLLSKFAPLVVAKNRYLGAKILDKKEFQIILMDDGFQNTQLKKDINILVFNNLKPFGNGLIIPSGPLRETLKSAAPRTDIVVGIGDYHNSDLGKKVESFGLKYMHATIIPKLFNIDLTKNYLAFCSIGYSNKFYNTLRANGIRVKLTESFKDHYLYTNDDIANLISKAKQFNLRLITTAKDYVKISSQYYSYIDKLDIDINLNIKDKNFLIDFILNKLTYKSLIRS